MPDSIEDRLQHLFTIVLEKELLRQYVLISKSLSRVTEGNGWKQCNRLSYKTSNSYTQLLTPLILRVLILYMNGGSYSFSYCKSHSKSKNFLLYFKFRKELVYFYNALHMLSFKNKRNEYCIVWSGVYAYEFNMKLHTL